MKVRAVNFHFVAMNESSCRELPFRGDEMEVRAVNFHFVGMK